MALFWINLPTGVLADYCKTCRDTDIYIAATWMTYDTEADKQLYSYCQQHVEALWKDIGTYDRKHVQARAAFMLEES